MCSSITLFIYIYRSTYKYLVLEVYTGLVLVYFTFVEHDDTRSVGLAVTDTYISLVVENHQWPLPRLQASLPENIRGQQFVLLDRQKINNIATIVSMVHILMQLFFATILYLSRKHIPCTGIS